MEKQVSSQKVSKKGKKYGHLAVKVAFFLVLDFSILNILSSFFIVKSTKKDITSMEINQHIELTKSYSGSVTKNIDKYLACLDFYSNSDVSKTGNTAAIVSWLKSQEKNRSPEFDYVAYVDAAGNFYSDKGAVTSVKERDYYQAIIKEGKNIYVDNPVVSKTSGKTIIHICKAVKSGGKNVGFWCGVIDASRLQNLFAGIDVDNGETILIFAKDGRIISSNKDMTQIQEMFNQAENQIANINERLAGVNEENNSGYCWENFNKVRYLCTFDQIDETPYVLVIAVKEYDVSISALRVGNYVIGGGIGLAVLVAICVIVTLGIMIVPIKSVNNTLGEISFGEADLTQRIATKTFNDEIASVVDNFNIFEEKLQGIIKEIKESSESLKDSGTNLDASTKETAESIEEILACIQNLEKGINNQSDSVGQTAGAVNEIASNIESLNNMISSQVAAVTQASSAVEEMIGNINSVNQNVTKMAEKFNQLETKANEGVKLQDNVNHQLQSIEEESHSLQEANAVISSIAEQTNLLAMNAAIEAAHAGEAGKGFSVVADEIRKLSETSSVQSKTIGEQLKTITDSITSMVEASQNAGKSFTDVTGGINETTNLVVEIKNAMEEQAEGSKQISLALGTLNDNTSEVRTASQEMSVGNKQILEEIKNLQNATLSMKDGMTDMDISARKIYKTGESNAEMAKNMDASIKRIAAQIEKFKV